ncbi:unnamed protein product [Penicillium roqueforti FM164]|uniref:Genomic scaffold, ProqFM164S01 n=1 Tax=Penicillium roqueforti (strain FM164) TaxID=1365484 RepID=W6PQ22_PENRF|nr:unnamed protein product [Penicillium roqueforti FM164]
MDHDDQRDNRLQFPRRVNAARVVGFPARLVTYVVLHMKIKHLIFYNRLDRDSYRTWK